jgi:hypothetical protein
MSNTLNTVVGISVIFVGLPLAILWLRDCVNRARHRWRNPPEKIAADRITFEERLLRPDWDFYERHLQRPVPSALRELYADRALITACGHDYTIADRISTFSPLDERGLLDTKPWLGFDAVAIATSDFGDPIYLRPGQAEGDVVYITHHDGGDTDVFADSVAEMIKRLRDAKRDAEPSR